MKTIDQEGRLVTVLENDGAITALTGDVVATGPGSVTATIQDGVVCFAKIQDISTNRLIGRSTASAGDIEEIQIGSGLTLSSGTLSASGGGGGSPGGSDTDIQYNDGGSFNGQSTFNYLESLNSVRLACGGIVASGGTANIVTGVDDTTGVICSGGIGNIMSIDSSSTACGYIAGNVNHVHILTSSSSFTVCGDGNHIHGKNTNTSSLNGNGVGGEIAGWADGGVLQVDGSGTKALGTVTSGCAAICANGHGAIAAGYCNGGFIYTSGAGNQARGYACGSGTICSTSEASVAYGYAISCGVICATSYAATAFGYASDSSGIYGGNAGSLAHGYTENSGSYIQSSAAGGHAFGTATGFGIIFSTGYGGTVAHGQAANCGVICSGGFGSYAFGFACDSGTFSSCGAGSVASGWVCAYGSIISTGSGAHAYGYANDSGSGINAAANAVTVFGSVACGGYITACSDGSLVFGFSNSSSAIISTSSTAVGGMAFGYACGGDITSNSNGTFIGGYAACGDMVASGCGSFAFGRTDGYSIITACGTAFAFGVASCGDVIACGNRAVAFGDSITAQGDDCYAFGSGFTNSTATSFQIGFNQSRFKVDASYVSVKAAGSSGHIAKVGGSIDQSYADANNTSTTETDLYSYTIPASTLGTSGEKLQGIFGGSFLGSTSSKRLRVYFNGTTIFDSTAVAVAANADWYVKVVGIRDSGNSMRFITEMVDSGMLAFTKTQYVQATSVTFSGSITFKITGTASGAGAASNDITAKVGVVEWKP